jgi:hypothetical protein
VKTQTYSEPELNVRIRLPQSLAFQQSKNFWDYAEYVRTSSRTVGAFLLSNLDFSLCPQTSSFPSRTQFQAVVRELMDEFDIWPVVFAGDEHRVIVDWLLQKWASGSPARLGIRPPLVALKHFAFCLGNEPVPCRWQPRRAFHVSPSFPRVNVPIFDSRTVRGIAFPDRKLNAKAAD